MPNPPDQKKVILVLLAAGLLLPVAVTVAVALGGLLGVMGDAAGAAVVRYVAMGLGAAWALILACLILFQAWVGLSSGRDGEIL